MTHVSSGHLLSRIRAYFRDVELDVVCLKKRGAYAVYWADDRLPLAKLRPTGRGDCVEVFYWDDNHWESISESGLVLPLDESLKYIVDDPNDLFFEADDLEDDDADELPPEFIERARWLHTRLCLCVLAGGVVGGLFTGVVWGGASGALAGAVCCLLYGRLLWRASSFLPRLVLVCTPVMLLAGAAGLLGSSVNGAVSHGVWGPVCGLLAGAFFGILALTGSWITGATGFSAGLLLAASLMEPFQLRDHLVGVALIAIAAGVSGCVYGWLGGLISELCKCSGLASHTTN